jgi:hypothetical protein
MSSEESFVNERDPSIQYEVFKQSILEPVDGISGERIKRVGGAFSIVNDSGELVEIHFATCTHEDEPDSKAASVAELDFLRRHLLQEHSPSEILLVEQGSPGVTENHTQTIIDEIALADSPLAQQIAQQTDKKSKRRNLTSYSSEIKILPEEFKKIDKRSLNIDLTLNPLSYQYIYEDKGLEDVVFYACCDLSNYVVDWKKYTPELVVEMLKRCLDLSVDDLRRVKDLAKDYLEPLDDLYDLYISKRNHDTDNAYRDVFMAKQIKNLPQGTYKLLCHTSHLMGIIENSKTMLSQIDLHSIELAVHTLERQKRLRK